MKATRNLGISVWAVLAVLLVGGAVTAYMADNTSGRMAKTGNGNQTGMRGCMGQADQSTLNLPANATRQEIRTAMETRMNETRAQIEAAVASGDYNPWKTAVEQTAGGNMLTAKITEANFPKYVEMQGYLTKANSIAAELGLQNKGMIRGRGRGSFHMGGEKMPGNNPANPQANQ